MGSIPKTLISKILNDQTEKCTSNPDRFIKALTYMVRVYYGLNVDSERDPVKKNELLEVFTLFRNQVFTKFPQMTFEQFNLIHSESKIEKRQGVGLTVDELMHPMASYYAKIQFVLNERNVVLKKEQEKAIEELKKSDFKKEAVELYIKCVNSDGIWTGTCFQASVFAKESFAHRFEQSEKDKFWKLAQEQHAESEAKRNLNVIDQVGFLDSLPVPSAQYLFCQIIVIEACKRWLEIIIY